MSKQQKVSHYNQSIPLERRRAGILLHPTSLPGPYANGVLGEDAYRFVDFLVDSGFSVWQTLPLGPTHDDGSPYQSLSVHAGNAQLIDLKWLVDKEWLAEHDLNNCFADVFGRSKCLLIAFHAFHHQCGQDPNNKDCLAFDVFIKEQAFWLDDYAFYCALKKEHQNKSWVDWPDGLKNHQEHAIKAMRQQLKNDIFYYQFEQYIFFSQWLALKAYANNKGIYLFGDLPIFVAHDSACLGATCFF
jgi:4-alpha-glucanotransferase